MIVGCTKKLADAMKIKLNPYEDKGINSFYEWHANMNMFDRRKCVVLMNDKTRYCIVLYGVKMEHFKKFGEISLQAIKENFLAEGFDSEIVEDYIAKCGEVQFTKTHDRSILGQLNEFYIHISWRLEDYLPSEDINLIELNKWVNESLMCCSKGYEHPLNLLKLELNNE